ncbi:MAG: hypothetical protein LBD13_02240 [Spirochaetaceae bacterium]|nr:hypothetical protein [Spirochaetaceae bacterium]
MNSRERHGMRGLFTMRIYRRGKLVETYRGNNLIVGNAREIAAQFISGAVAGRRITGIGFGANGSAPQNGGTALAGACTKEAESVSYPALGQAEFK